MDAPKEEFDYARHLMEKREASKGGGAICIDVTCLPFKECQVFRKKNEMKKHYYQFHTTENEKHDIWKARLCVVLDERNVERSIWKLRTTFANKPTIICLPCRSQFVYTDNGAAIRHFGCDRHKTNMEKYVQQKESESVEKRRKRDELEIPKEKDEEESESMEKKKKGNALNDLNDELFCLYAEFEQHKKKVKEGEIEWMDDFEKRIGNLSRSISAIINKS